MLRTMPPNGLLGILKDGNKFISETQIVSSSSGVGEDPNSFIKKSTVRLSTVFCDLEVSRLFRLCSVKNAPQ